MNELAATAIEVGFGHVGAGSQVTLATQPALFTDESLKKWNVKQPDASDEVNGPGIVVPQKEPGKPPGTLPPSFELEI